MDKHLKESLSALMDEEANELELQRILSSEDNDDINECWTSYHLVRDVLRQGNSELAHIDVSNVVSAALEADESKDVPALSTRNTKSESSLSLNKPVERTSFKMRNLSALAASIAFIFAVFWQGDINQPFDQLGPVVADLNSEQGGFQQVSTLTRQPKMHETMSVEHARQFNQYLLRHAEHSIRGTRSGLMPLARVASVNSVGI